MPNLTAIDRFVLEEVERRGLFLGSERPLWPDRYRPPSEDDEDLTGSTQAAYRFVTECCWTFNEAGGLVELIPAHDYIEWFTNEWLLNRRDGGTLICEKSRRLIMSWVCRSLELWAMGLKRSKFVICGLNYSKSAEHVWRIAWLYGELRKHRPDFRLAECSTRGGSMAAQQMEQVILPNGSLVESLNQQGASFQGSGYTGVTMEEFSQYSEPNYMYAQAGRVTEGKPGDPGGFVVAITNAWPGLEWQKLKK